MTTPIETKPRKTPLLLIFVTVFIDLLGFGIVLPLLPRYAKHFQASGLVIGALMASFSVMQFLFAPVWGRISDRIGRRPVLLIGLLGSTVFYGLFGYATSLGAEGVMLGLGVMPWLFITRIGAGIAGATIPTAQAYIADVTGQNERAKGMALIGAAFGIGFTFGPLLGAISVSGDTSDPGTFRKPEIANRLLITESQQTQIDETLNRYKQRLEEARSKPRKERQQIKDEREREVLALLSPEQRREWRVISAPRKEPGYVASFLSGIAFLCALVLLPESLHPGSRAAERHWLDWSSLRIAISKPEIGHILGTMFLTIFAFAQFETTLALLTEYLGLADRHNYFLFAYIGFVLTLSQGMLVRRLVPRLGEVFMSVAGTVLMTIGFVLVGIAGQKESVGMLFAVVPFCVIGFSALNPSLQSLLSRRTDASMQGGVLGLGQSIAALARIFGPLIGLPLADKDVALPYWTSAVIMGVGVLLTMLLRAPATTPSAAAAE